MTALTSFCSDFPFDNKGEQFKSNYLDGMSRLTLGGHLYHRQCPNTPLCLICLETEIQIRLRDSCHLLFLLPFIQKNTSKSSIDRKSEVRMRVARSCESLVHFIFCCLTACEQLNTCFGNRGKIPRYGYHVWFSSPN